MSITESSPQLAQLIASLADNKYFLGRRYAEWCSSAPALEAAVAAAAMAQDEIGHARSLYPLLRDVMGPGTETEPETRTGFTHVPFLRRPFLEWTDFVAANFLFDTALTVLIQSAQESSSSALAQRARRIVQEEQMHWLHGEGWVRRLASSPPGVRHALDRSLAAVAPDTLEWLEIVRPVLVEEAIVDAGANALRDRYLARITPTLEADGLRVGR